MNFASDNTAAIAPGILTALARANEGFALGYGNDELTRVDRAAAIGELFEKDVAVFLVPTGTAANALSLAHITPPWGGVLCHEQAHIMTDECGAPEFFGGGIKLIGLPGENTKLTPDTVATAIARYCGHVPHQVNAAALSITQATEGGTHLPRRRRSRRWRELAHAHGLAGAYGRRALRQCAGAHECVAGRGDLEGGRRRAVVRRHQGRRDGGGGGGVLRSAARGLHGASGASAPGICFRSTASSPRSSKAISKTAIGSRSRAMPTTWPICWPTACARPAHRSCGRSRPISYSRCLPKALDAKLKAAGAAYYVRSNALAGDDVAIAPDRMLVRLVTSFATQRHEVEQFVVAGAARLSFRIAEEKKMKVAVIGASGRGGSRIVEELARRGHQVTAIARNTGEDSGRRQRHREEGRRE